MAKRKKGKRFKARSAMRSHSIARAALDFANTPAGRLVISEALVLMAGALAPKHPVKAAAEAGSSAASTAGDFAGRASEGAAKALHALADHLRGDGGGPAWAGPGREESDVRNGQGGGNGGTRVSEPRSEVDTAQALAASRGKKGKRAGEGTSGKKHTPGTEHE